MCARNNAPASGSDSPFSTAAYTPKELGAILLDFYIFLTTIHYDRAELKIPPPGGWPGLTAEFCAGLKSDYAIKVIRHLPYFEKPNLHGHNPSQLHYKSELIDYSSCSRRELETICKRWEYWVDFESSKGVLVDLKDVISITTGHESGGRELLLDVKHGEITEHMIRGNPLDPVDIRSYFNGLKEAYRSLDLIPCRGMVTIIDESDEANDNITENQVCAQIEEWGTDLDIQYIKQIYRQHGWPYAFRRDDAEKAIDKLHDKLSAERVSNTQADMLFQWILDLDKRELPPRPAFVENMANYLLSTRSSTTSPPRVGKNWVSNIIKRRTELQCRYSRRCNHERAKCEDIKVIREWFKTLEDTLTQYGITLEDIYNFDETGFAMGLCATTKVITSAEYYSQAKLLQPGNREWVTVIRVRLGSSSIHHSQRSENSGRLV
ncbi:hypothetical protein ACJ73_09697 [Blastomyces percursus]|uniref:HTH CENPB-type domain-containing protein n=1 Tax=Blastomyces percursus TaxID=1658174 RepID=A0A1J9PSF2_9EURO|nr:hypothetical protein ACJ73_09697 [Blastomyces percursus]